MRTYCIPLTTPASRLNCFFMRLFVTGDLLFAAWCALLGTSDLPRATYYLLLLVACYSARTRILVIARHLTRSLYLHASRPTTYFHSRTSHFHWCGRRTKYDLQRTTPFSKPEQYYSLFANGFVMRPTCDSRHTAYYLVLATYTHYLLLTT